MRTTIRIDDEVYRRVKQVADRSDRTIGQVIEDAIQLAFRPTRNDDVDRGSPRVRGKRGHARGRPDIEPIGR